VAHPAAADARKHGRLLRKPVSAMALRSAWNCRRAATLLLAPEGLTA